MGDVRTRGERQPVATVPSEGEDVVGQGGLFGDCFIPSASPACFGVCVYEFGHCSTPSASPSYFGVCVCE